MRAEKRHQNVYRESTCHYGRKGCTRRRIRAKHWLVDSINDYYDPIYKCDQKSSQFMSPVAQFAKTGLNKTFDELRLTENVEEVPQKKVR